MILKNQSGEKPVNTLFETCVLKRGDFDHVLGYVFETYVFVLRFWAAKIETLGCCENMSTENS